MSTSSKEDSISVQNGSFLTDTDCFSKDLPETSDIKDEIPDATFGEHGANGKIKCGEVYASGSGGWTLICAFCNEEFETFSLFGEHIRVKHECRISWSRYNTEVHTVEVSPFLTKVESEEDTSENESNSMPSMGENEILSNADVAGKYFNCNVCHRSYKLRSSLNRHRATGRCRSKLQQNAITNEAATEFRDVPVENRNNVSSEADKLVLRSDCNDIEVSGQFNNVLNESDSESSGSKEYDDEESFRPSDSENETTEGNEFSCDVCHRSFKYKRSLIRHKKQPKPCKVQPTNFFCVPCNRQLNSLRTLRRHQKRHGLVDTAKPENKNVERTEPKEYHCDICDTMFKTKYGLQMHSDDHETLPAELQGNLDFLQCKFCNKKFDKFSQRKQCEGTHTSNRPYECPFCKKGFLSNYDRKVHVRTHTGEKAYQCPHCSKVCTNSTDMKRHIERHSNIRKFGCNLCDKRFYRKFEMTRHMRTHTKERPYVCEDCGATYPVLAQLKDHQLRHTGVKNIKCEICGRLFYSRSVLKVHMPTHFDEKPFECDVCGRKFSRAKAMQKHQKLHSGVKKYVCNICGKAYAQDSGLYAHKKSHGANITS